MNSDTTPLSSNLDRSHSQGYVSPGSDTRKSSTSSSKKRASRAGTRSVTTLSAAQLERKRANDREAQRAIRQRTKDHIDHLERSINELRGSQEANEKVVHATQQRNRELEEENAFLRNKLSETGYSINLLPEHQRPQEAGLLAVPNASPGNASGASVPHSGSASTPSSHSITTQSTGSRHGSWQHQTAGYVGDTSTPIGLHGASAVGNAPNLTAWRSHDSAQSMSSVQAPSSSMRDPMQAPSTATYHPDQRVDWTGNGAPYTHYVSQEQQRPSQYETAAPQQQQQQQQSYQPTGVQPYGASATPQPSTYHPQLTPQNDFSVSSSPGSYQVPAFQQPTSFAVTPMQVPTSGTEYSTSTHGQMQPPPLPNSSFHPAPGEQAFGAPPTQPSSMQHYRDESANRSYSLTHYPTA